MSDSGNILMTMTNTQEPQNTNTSGALAVAKAAAGLKLYDTASHAVSSFTPIKPGQVGIYVCGATVQSSPHIGHIRAAVAFDVVRRWFERLGYKVTFVRNVTDIDDKILDKAAAAGQQWWERAYIYEREFTEAYSKLGVEPPTYEPRATGHMIDMIDLIKKSENNQKYKVYAVVAPSISSQFTYAKLGQVISGIKALGFHTVIEAALGADMVAEAESRELVEKGFLTSSCCPAFVSFIEKNFPTMVPHISHNLSPMATIAKYIKEHEEGAKIVFIGPSTAKKAEVQREAIKPYVDAAMTFEELQALFDSRDIDITTLGEDVLDNASYFGRIFARSGGLSDGVKDALMDQGIEDFDLKPCACDGIEECRIALLKKNKNLLDANFIEGMACIGGCIGGAGCLTHGEKNKAEVDKYGMEAYEKTIADATSVLKH